MTLSALLTAAEQRGEITPADRARVEEFCARDAARETMPWYLHVVVTVGAWTGSAFLCAFVFALLGTLLLKSATVGMVLGAVGIALAAAVARATRAVFLRQAALAVSVAAHVLFFWGVADWPLSLRHELPVLTCSAAALAALLYRLYPDPLHRFLSTASALFLSTLWAIWSKHFSFESLPEGFFRYGHEWLQLSLVAHLAALVLIFGRPGARLSLRPLGYAVAVSLIGIFLLPAISLPGPHRYAGLAPVVATLLAAGGWRRAQRRRGVWIVIVLALVALAFTSGPATPLAIFFLVLGYGLQDRAFLVFGTVLAPVFLTMHYYRMTETLLHKSVYLGMSGAVLLVLHSVLKNLPSEKEAGS